MAFFGGVERAGALSRFGHGETMDCVAQGAGELPYPTVCSSRLTLRDHANRAAAIHTPFRWLSLLNTYSTARPL